MAIKYNILDDGSIEFEEVFDFFSSIYSRDPENPKRYIPKFDSCRHRRLEIKTLDCGKKISDWQCLLLCKSVNVPICRGCNEPGK